MNEHKYVDDLIWIAKNRGDSISRQLSDIVQSQDKEIEQLKPRELTDEEIEQIAIKYYVGSRILPLQFARAIIKASRGEK
jgi:hypothetical protein